LLKKKSPALVRIRKCLQWKEPSCQGGSVL
jgi:hypothetical protein